MGTNLQTYGRLNIGSTGTQLYNGITIYSTDGTESFLGLGCSGTTAGINVTYGSTGSYLPFVFLTGGSERMRIQSDGKILAGTNTTTPTTSFKFRYNADGANDVMAIVLNNGTANNTSYIAFRTGTGEGSYKADIRFETGALSLNNISDVRFKENIIDAPTNEQWNKVKNSKLRKFDFKDKTATNQLGFIAQELYQTIPEAISKGGDEEEFDGNEKKIWTIASTNMIPAMFGALQEAIARIETLETEITELKNK